MTEFIVYVKMLKNKRLVIGKMKLTAYNGSYESGENNACGKLIYFELKKNIRGAQSTENKFKSLTRNKLMRKIKNINPELLDLKQTINNNKYFKELIY